MPEKWSRNLIQLSVSFVSFSVFGPKLPPPITPFPLLTSPLLLAPALLNIRLKQRGATEAIRLPAVLQDELKVLRGRLVKLSWRCAPLCCSFVWAPSLEKRHHQLEFSSLTHWCTRDLISSDQTKANVRTNNLENGQLWVALLSKFYSYYESNCQKNKSGWGTGREKKRNCTKTHKD